MDTSPSVHPSQRLLAAYALKRLSGPNHEKIRRHLSKCATCSGILARSSDEVLKRLLTRRPPQASDDSTSVRRIGETKPAIAPANVEDTPEKVEPKHDTNGPGSSASIPDLERSLPTELQNQSKYEIRRLLGRGGMGAVYEAFHTRMGRPVAIKVISPTLVDNPDAIRRFDQEVRIAAQLDHPNITRAYDAETIGDVRILVMELVSGRSLDKFLGKHGSLSIRHSCRIARQIALGLQHAHERGTVHRDLKPQNVMITSDGRVKLLDFGLGKLASEKGQGAGITRENALMGTPHYLAPEQALDAASADIRADIYSLGCTLYCMLTGVPPFNHETEMKVLLAHQNEPPPRLDAVRPDIPPGLADFVSQMLAKRPAERPSTPAEVASYLKKLTSNSSGESPDSLADHATPFTNLPTLTRAHSLTSRRHWLLILGTLSLLALVGFFTIGLPEETRQSHPPALTFPQAAKAAKATPLSEQPLPKETLPSTSLHLPTGSVRIDGVPHDATIYLDEKLTEVRREEGSVRIDNVPLGSHRLVVLRDNQFLWNAEVVIRSPDEVVLVKHSPSQAERNRSDPKRYPSPQVLFGGEWKIDGAVLRQEQHVSSSVGLIFGDPQWTDYDLQLEVQSGDPAKDGCIFVAFSATPHDKLRSFVIPTGVERAAEIWDAANLRDLRIQRTSATKLASINDDRWHRVRIEVRQSTCRCYLDDREIITTTNASFRSGAIGVGTLAIPANFREIRVTSPAGEPRWVGLPDLANMSRKAVCSVDVDPEEATLYLESGAAVVSRDEKGWRVRADATEENFITILVSCFDYEPQHITWKPAPGEHRQKTIKLKAKSP